MTNHFPHKTQSSKTGYKKTGYATCPVVIDASENEFAKYIKRAFSFKNLSAAEEAEIAQKAKNGDKEAKKALVNANLKLVFAIAKKSIHVAKIPYVDLIQEGNLGLMVAVEKFNPTLGYRFSTYAAWWIKQAMFKAISEQSYCMKIPVYVQETLSKFSKVKSEMERAYNCQVKNEDVARKINIEPEKIASYLSAYTTSVSIDASVDGKDGSEMSFSEILSDDSVALDDNLEYERLKHDLRVVISTLKEREQDVLRMRFGLENQVKRTLEDIGNIYGVTKECIRQTEARALNKMRLSGMLNCYAD